MCLPETKRPKKKNRGWGARINSAYLDFISLIVDHRFELGTDRRMDHDVPTSH